MAEQDLNTKVITGKVRFSYAHVHEPHAMKEGDTKQYSVAILIPKKDKATLLKIKIAIEAAKELGKNKHFGGKIPANLKTPVRDGDEDKPDSEEYAGMYFINATSKRNKPAIFDENNEPIINRDQFYSGCWGRASINFYAFNVQNKGIACGLNAVQFLEDGENLAGGGGSCTKDFAEDAEGIF